MPIHENRASRAIQSKRTVRHERRWIWLAFVIHAAIGCSGGGKQKLEVSGPGPDQVSDEEHSEAVAGFDADLIDQLSLLTTGKLLDDAVRKGTRSQWINALQQGDKSTDDYIAFLLNTSSFAQAIAPGVFVGPRFLDRWKMFGINDVRSALKRTKTKDGREILHLREACAPAEAVKVHPWWDISSEVLVCRDSYRPKLLRYGTGGRTSYCGAQWKQEKCGCGPNLLRCAVAGKHVQRLTKKAQQEVLMTTAHIVENDLPIASLFTTNKTYRDWETEFLYLQQELSTGEMSDLTSVVNRVSSWEGAKLRPRHELAPGQHAGILSTPFIQSTWGDLRQIMREAYGMLWCAPVDSKGATVHDVLSLETAEHQGRHENWQELARRPVCTNCHARLDFGMQFFLSLGDYRIPGRYILPELQRRDKVRLYGKNINDPRELGDPTPAGFAKLATSQPEFGSCMAARVTGHVFGHEASAEAKHEVLGAYKKNPTARHLFKVALERFAKNWRQTHPQKPAGQYDEAGDRKRLNALIEEYCAGCHEVQSPSLSPADLSNDVLLRLGNQVAYGDMPKGSSMPPAHRREMVRIAVRQALPKKDWKAAESYYLVQGQSVSVHGVETAFERIDAVARAWADDGRLKPLANEGWRALHEASLALSLEGRQWTPSFAGTVGLRAIRACRRAGLSEAKIEECIEKATDPRALSKTTQFIPQASKDSTLSLPSDEKTNAGKQ